MTTERAQLPAVAATPELDDPGAVARGQHAISGPGCDGPYGLCVSEQALPLAAAGNIPQPDRSVSAARRKRLPVGREAQAADPARMAGERAELSAARHVPELNRLVRASGCQDTAVRRESDCFHRSCVP